MAKKKPEDKDSNLSNFLAELLKNKDATKALLRMNTWAIAERFINVLERLADAIEEVPRSLLERESREIHDDQGDQTKAAYWLRATTKFWIAKTAISIVGFTAVTVLGVLKVIDQGTLGMLMAAVVASLFVPPARRE